jgi:ATP-binding cassette subfamily B protein
MTFMQKYMFRYILGLLMSTIISVLYIINPRITGQIVDDVIIAEKYNLLPGLLLIIIIATSIRSLLRYHYQITFEKCSQGMLFDLREAVYRKLLLKDFRFYNKNRTGDLMSRQTGDMEAIRHFAAFSVYAIYENILIFVFALIMIFTLDLNLALAMFAVLPLTALTTYFQMKAVRPAFRRMRESFSSLNTFVQENISGNRVVRAFAKEDFETEKFSAENDNYKNVQLEAANVWSKYVPTFEFLSNVLMVIMMLYGGYRTIIGEMTLGNLVSVNGYLWMLTMPLRMCGWYINDIQRFATSIEKIFATHHEEPIVQNLSIPLVKKKYEGNVVFENVSYSSDDEDIIRDISCEVKKGQTVGIIGVTGSGKSTIMNLLCRFYDTTDGRILIDRINVKNIDLYDLRSNIGIAMQDTFLFSDTVEGNIAYGMPDCSFEEVKKAAIMADAEHFIKNMPEGYDTIIGERGVGLSGGQRQRISLARALIKHPSILILDDTTSAVDMETESYIQYQLKNLEHHCTTFVIAHRISSIIDADIIMVMADGRIIEQGNHEELLVQNGYYAQAFHNQYGDYYSRRKVSHGAK